MDSSTRKNQILAVVLCVVALAGIIVIVSAVAEARRGLLRVQTHNDLKWIVMALHQYHDHHGHFPAAVVRGEPGHTIHSWRSVIQLHLADIAKTADDFGGYTFSEPWNSKSNRESARRHRFGDHPYQFLAVVGPHAAWSPDGSRKLKDFTDGTGNTVLFIAMRNTGTAWNEPVDAVVTEQGTLAVNGHPLNLSGDVFVATADGSVRYSRDGIDNKTLSAFITINAGDNAGDW